MIEELKAELLVLNLLRQVFLKEPEKALLEGFVRVTIPPDEENGEPAGLTQMIASVRENGERLGEWMEELSFEFARLFIGPAHPPAVPFASFYLSETQSLMTEETLEVRKWYLEAGLAAKDLYQVPDDHIAMELEFVYFLTEQALQSLETANKEDGAKRLEMRDNFLRQHLGVWVPVFATQVLQSSKETFFRGAAALLLEYVEPWRSPKTG